jgi:hypothetical protein
MGIASLAAAGCAGMEGRIGAVPPEGAGISDRTVTMDQTIQTEIGMTAKIQTISLGFVNCYLVNTDAEFVLIDTGVRVSRAAIEKALIHPGYSAMVENGAKQPKRTIKSPLMRLMHLAMRISSANGKMTADFERCKPDIDLAEGQRLKESSCFLVFSNIRYYVLGHLLISFQLAERKFYEVP